MKIIGTGSCVPEYVVTNERLSEIVDTSDAWITSRTGIKERRIAIEETTEELAAEAAGRALQDAGIEAGQVDLIIAATLSPEGHMPSVACFIQKEVGAQRAFAFDVNAACSGFLFALHTAQAYIEAGMYETILVAGAEVLSRLVDWEDRGTCVLFGDGAGAAVVQKSKNGMTKFLSFSNGNMGNVLTCGGYREANPFQDKSGNQAYIKMDGQEVFKFAVKKVPECIEQLLDECGLLAGDIDHFILHQANKRILEVLAKRMKADISRFPMNLDKYGNTSAASIAILLDEVNKKGLLKEGDRIVLSGFGGGLTWGAALIEW